MLGLELLVVCDMQATKSSYRARKLPLMISWS